VVELSGTGVMNPYPFWLENHLTVPVILSSAILVIGGGGGGGGACGRLVEPVVMLRRKC